MAGALGSGPVEAMGGDVERVTLNKRAAATAAMEEMPNKLFRIESSESMAAPETEVESEVPCSMSEVPHNKSEVPCSMSEVPNNKSEVSSNKSEVSSNKSEMSSNKSEMSSNKSEMSSNKSELPRNKSRLTESKVPYKESEMSCTESGAAFKSVTSGLVNETTMEVAHIMGTMVRQAMEGGAPMLQAWMANKRPAGN